MSRQQAIEQAVNGVIAKWDLTGFIDTSTKDYSLMIAIKEALALPDTAKPVAYTTPPSVDALIAEIDALPPKLYEISTHPWTEDAYPVDELKAILDKYRSG